MASYHYIVGPDEVIQLVDEKDVSFGAPPNDKWINVAHVGVAIGFTDKKGVFHPKTDWLAQRSMLEKSANLVRCILGRWKLPAERVTGEGLLAGAKGISTHDAVRVFGKTNHVDPGGQGDKNWPWEEYLRLVKGLAGEPLA
jgi:hypothetical protein